MQTKQTIPIKVSAFRAAGLEARWTKHEGTPFIALRNPNANLKHQRNNWWLLTKQMHAMMQDHGILEGFDNSTLLGDIFSI